MRRVTFVVLGGVLLLVASAVRAAEPDAAAIVAKMQAALEPPRSSVRLLDIVISTEHGDDAQTTWKAGQARAQVDGLERTLTVVLAPESARGIALLAHEMKEGGAFVQWVYVPYVRRVRKLTPLHDYDAWMNSDFTYADLMFTHIPASYESMGTAEIGGRRVEHVRAKPVRDRYYSHTETWIDPDTFLPLRRDLFGPAGDLWKVESFRGVTTVEGTPTVGVLRIENRQTKGWTEIRASNVHYDVDLPADLFDAGTLPTAHALPVWSQVAK